MFHKFLRQGLTLYSGWLWPGRILLPQFPGCLDDRREPSCPANLFKWSDTLHLSAVFFLSGPLLTVFISSSSLKWLIFRFPHSCRVPESPVYLPPVSCVWSLFPEPTPPFFFCWHILFSSLLKEGCTDGSFIWKFHICKCLSFCVWWMVRCRVEFKIRTTQKSKAIAPISWCLLCCSCPPRCLVTDFLSLKAFSVIIYPAYADSSWGHAHGQVSSSPFCQSSVAFFTVMSLSYPFYLISAPCISYSWFHQLIA